MSFGSNLVYVWTAGGDLASMTIPPALLPVGATAAAPPKQNQVVKETFVDNLRRTVSGVNQYSEIPYNNILTTRMARETVPVFRFTLSPNKIYKLNIQLRAKVAYKFTVPILVKYYIESNRPEAFMNYKASYISSNETAMGVEKTTNTLGTALQMIVDTRLTIVRIEATFQTNANFGTNGVELRLHHGIKTDDPEATLFCMEGSVGVLTELLPTNLS